MTDGPGDATDTGGEVVVEPEPGGPLVIRGPVRVTDHEGTELEAPPEVRLCRCGRTANAPWCDDSHLLGWAGRAG